MKFCIIKIYNHKSTRNVYCVARPGRPPRLQTVDWDCPRPAAPPPGAPAPPHHRSSPPWGRLRYEPLVIAARFFRLRQIRRARAHCPPRLAFGRLLIAKMFLFAPCHFLLNVLNVKRKRKTDELYSLPLRLLYVLLLFYLRAFCF